MKKGKYKLAARRKIKLNQPDLDVLQIEIGKWQRVIVERIGASCMVAFYVKEGA